MKICKTASTKVMQKLAKALLKSFQVSAYELATKYLQGNGVEQSFDLSANALDKACKMGSKRACNVLELVPKN